MWGEKCDYESSSWKTFFLFWNKKEEPEAGINFAIENELDYTSQNLEKQVWISFLLHCLLVFLIQLFLAAHETQDITCSKRELHHLLEFVTFYLASVQSKKSQTLYEYSSFKL